MCVNIIILDIDDILDDNDLQPSTEQEQDNLGNKKNLNTFVLFYYILFIFIIDSDSTIEDSEDTTLSTDTDTGNNGLLYFVFNFDKYFF